MKVLVEVIVPLKRVGDKFVEACMDIEWDADILSATASDVLFGEELIQNIYREPKETENADCTGNTENAETQGTTSMGEIEPGLAQTDCYTFESQNHDQDSLSDAERLAEIQS
ncbi:hypothetical protein SARC_00232 [Sphaeroforma arctica JP610]|uniref:Uncharacterized protein n=1 Tax=Sphaeroforma arctica JP610 TaxID=667725 RepID=A0A0L0GFP7_9EUKA|nr:hypothetical protein SARC_00232 [Sphaeroforma arctica JP610]KNC87661.1 hypothetical protein SARC_00232 [Sphaeroforma arctica JP610]|eukprot:XP_014161563.1 hypothetical protein SARC_00232 [Sphaeroforma arctica JP610]